MRRYAACAIVAALLLVVWTPAAQAGSSLRISVGFVAPLPLLPPLPIPVVVHRPGHRVIGHRPVVVHRPGFVHRPVVVATVVPRPIVYPAPTVVYAAPPVAYAPPVAVAPPPPTVIHYPHGRYELHLQGQQYVWVWIPVTPPPPPPPPAAAPQPTQ